MGIKTINEDPFKDAEPLRAEAFVETALFGTVYLDGCLSLIVLLLLNSQPPTTTRYLSVGSEDRDSRQRGEESEEREDQRQLERK